MRHRILGRTLAEPVHPAHPVGNQVRPVRGQPGRLDHSSLPAASIARSVMAGLPGIHTNPDHITNHHPGRPLISAGQPHGQPRRQVPKQRRLASDLNQRPGSPRRRGGHSPRATTTATSHQPHPAAPGIQGTNPGQLRP
jgi:hypothetical protein